MVRIAGHGLPYSGGNIELSSDLDLTLPRLKLGFIRAKSF